MINRKFSVFLMLIVAMIFSTACTAQKNVRDNRYKMNQVPPTAQNDEQFFYNGSSDPDVKQDMQMSVAKPITSAANPVQQPVVPVENFDQRGLASWFGQELQGKKTASGEIFNINEYTAAHQDYPFGTILIVKNMQNNKSVRVRVNDRGPYGQKRIIDVSYAAAKELGMLANNETPVGITVLRKGDVVATRPEKPVKITNITEVKGLTPVAGDSTMSSAGFDSYGANYNARPVAQEAVRRPVSNTGAFSVQAGAFYSKRNADDFKDRLQMMTEQRVVTILEDDLYKVRIVNFGSRDRADSFKKMLKKENINSFTIEED